MLVSLERCTIRAESTGGNATLDRSSGSETAALVSLPDVGVSGSASVRKAL